MTSQPRLFGARSAVLRTQAIRILLQDAFSNARYRFVMALSSSPVEVLQAWVAAHPRYTYIVDATERTVNGPLASATLRITVDMARSVEDVHVVDGSGTGSDMHWSGGDTVDVRGPGIAHMISLRMNVRDARLLSPRKNDVRTGIFARVAACFAADPTDIRAQALPGGALVLTLARARGVACGPEYGSADITADRITLDSVSGQPISRERLVGSSVVERWVIRDLRAPT